MRNLHSSEDILTIIPQEETVVIDLNVYFSTSPGVRGEALEDDKYRSSRLNILGVGFCLINSEPYVNIALPYN